MHKSYRVRRRELDVAVLKLEETNLATAERRRTRAASPSFEDLYPEVVKAMTKFRS